MYRVLITDPIHDAGIKILRDHGFSVDLRPDIEYEELINTVVNYDAIIVRGRTRVSKEVIKAGKSLKLIVRAGVGLDNIDLEASKKFGVKVFNTPDAPSVAVAELTISLMLCLLRGICKGDKEVKKGNWIKRELIGNELMGKVVGVFGFGRIGYQVAKRVKCFGSHVIAYDVIDRRQWAEELRIEFTRDMDKILSQSDILTIHVPLLKSTYHLFNRDILFKMKKGSYLINTSRGPVVDCKALLEVLKKGHLAGAALDVLEHEPPVEDWEFELIRLPNVIVTPHIGAQTLEAQRRASIEAARIIVNFFSGGKR